MAGADALAVLDAIPREQIAAAIVRLSGRLIATPDAAGTDELLTPDETARLLRATRRFVYRHAAELGAVRLSRRKLRFNRARVLRYLERRRG